MGDLLPWLLAVAALCLVAWHWRRRAVARRRDEQEAMATLPATALTVSQEPESALDDARGAAERAAAEQAQAALLEAQRAEAARIEAEREAAWQAEQQRLLAEFEAAQQAEAERAQAEHDAAAAARAAAELELAQRAEAERAEAARIEQERAEAARIEQERAEAARVEQERAEAQRLQAEAEARAERERLAAQAEQQRLQAEREAQRAEAARIEQERAAAVARAEAAAEAEVARQAQPHRTSVKSPAQTMVLVADDSKVVRIKTGRLLAQHQYQVSYASDGLDAAQLLQQALPDLVITDVEMPGMDGFELTRHIRADPRSAQLPVIMITAADDRHREQAQAVGVSVLLGKPYPEDLLIAHIRQALGQDACSAQEALA